MELISRKYVTQVNILIIIMIQKMNKNFKRTRSSKRLMKMQGSIFEREIIMNRRKVI